MGTVYGVHLGNGLYLPFNCYKSLLGNRCGNVGGGYPVHRIYKEEKIRRSALCCGADMRKPCAEIYDNKLVGNVPVCDVVFLRLGGGGDNNRLYFHAHGADVLLLYVGGILLYKGYLPLVNYDSYHAYSFCAGGKNSNGASLRLPCNCVGAEHYLFRFQCTEKPAGKRKAQRQINLYGLR